MIRIIRSIILFTSLFIIQSCSSQKLMDKDDQFVQVKGNKFIYDDKPYYFVGTNFWYGCYIGSPGETGDRARLIRELDFLKSYGITNLRVLSSSEKARAEKTLKPAVQESPGIYNEQLLEGLDYLLAEMGKRNMHAVVFLNNYWEWSGGMAVYNEWFGAEKMPDLIKPDADWTKYMNYSASFYSNDEANKCFRKFIKYIVNRKNTITGKYYFEDPAIMAWQLANEPRPGWGDYADKNIDSYFKWIHETAKYIRSLDPNHLVTTGSEGIVGSGDSEEYYLKAHSSEYIDYVTFHLWAKNWGWFKADDMEGSYPTTEINALNYINKHIELAAELGKPATLEEFGLGRDYEKYHPQSAVNYRNKYFNSIFELIYKSASKGAPIAGTNFWTWGGEGRAQQDDYWWKQGDSFTGDPPGEPQGLNSVFNTDLSTLNIIKNHSEKMSELSNNN